MPVPARMPYTYDEVDSEALPASERFVLWRETGRLPMAAEPPDDESRRRFHIRVHKLSGPSGRFADLVATPMKLSRTKDHYNRDGLDMISLTLMLGPEVQHQFGTAGRSVVAQPGQILVKDFAQPATAWWQTSSRSLNLHLPRLTVAAAVGEKVTRLHGTVLSPAGVSPMLETQLITLANIAPRLRNAVRAAALDTTAELAASVLRCELGMRLEDEANSAGLFAGAQVFIKRNLASHRLNPELIARQLHCSRAHLYRVFTQHGETVADYVRELRLHRAHDLITSDPEGKGRIADIAYRCGFEDPVHFTRLFRQRFGLTPSALRASGAVLDY
jgi:AraC-like DNA-binding protein